MPVNIRTLSLALLSSGILFAGPAQASGVAPPLWEVTEAFAVHGTPPDNAWYDVQLTVKNNAIDGYITAFAVGVSDVNVVAYTSRELWQASVNHQETWEGTLENPGYNAHFGGMSWDTFIGGQTRADGSKYSWFALYYCQGANLGPVCLDPGRGIGPEDSSNQFSYTTSLYPASPVAIGVNGGVWSDAGSTTLVPEPGTWAMLLAGFGVVGWAVRKRG